MSKRRYFHSLDAFRFIFFMLVFLLHSATPATHHADFILKKGGVSFFFVLSGFLITYILLYEKQKAGKIDIRRFYKKRGLRIYPLFYLMILFAYLSPYILKSIAIPHEATGYKPNIWVSLLFLENYKMMFTHAFPDGTPLRIMWSLCVNEHFYLVWGLLLTFSATRKLPYYMAVGLVLPSIMRIIYARHQINDVDLLSNLDYFIFGAIPAYMLLVKPEFLSGLANIPRSIKYALALLIVLMPKAIFGGSYPVVSGFGFALLIVFTLPDANALHLKDHWWISKLGKYTYGMYLYHTICIMLVWRLFEKFAIEVHWTITATIALLLTILVSFSSYHLFEKQLLKIKERLR